ncbi:hypothetical protein HK097_011475 [Rhizophlyctis rosea]|uniref:lytic cellulose monooxygenase (C4-dehydrogenating) n=1 Tax=Rhizophlyctis rosea TaxID=64517 RepID=A0AAD5X7R6_9FUNG|nr:hypothetical protein HK097_011475 [Rhizophlyctis rosea]
MKSAAVLTTLALVGSAQAHYFVKAINGQTTCLRPISPPGTYRDNFPVTGAQIDNADVVCGEARALTTAQPPCTIAAGSTITLTYDNQVGHPGPEFIYIARTAAGPWAKINQDIISSDGKWANERFGNGQTTYTFTLPAALASGNWVLRTEHFGLHGALQAGGAQLYIRCIDINVTGSGTGIPGPTVQFPGAFTSSTPGVVWNPYGGTANNLRYPAVGPAVWNGSSSGGNPDPQPTTTTSVATTTTTTRTSVAPAPTTTTTTRTTTTTASGGQGAPLYGQCGGRNWTGATTCAQGTCKFSNDYYSQCLP